TSERGEERDELVLLRVAQGTVVVDDLRGLPGVAEDRLVAREGLPVVHQPVAAARAPQGGGAHLVARGLTAVLHDPVPGTHVVEKEIAERVDHLVAEGGRYGEGALVDDRPRGRGRDVADVAGRAADLA